MVGMMLRRSNGLPYCARPAAASRQVASNASRRGRRDMGRGPCRQCRRDASAAHTWARSQSGECRNSKGAMRDEDLIAWSIGAPPDATYLIRLQPYGLSTAFE